MRLWAAGIVVAEVGGGQRVDGLEAPFTGRDADLRLIKDLFHSTEESRRPRLVVLDAEAGIGKSRLAWELEKYVDGLAALVKWHRGRCLSYGDGVAFWALAEAMRTRFGLVEADTGDTVTERLDAGLVEFVPERRVTGTGCGRGSPVLLGAGAGGSFAREDLFAAWTAFLEHLAENEMVVLVLDDAQHADEGLLDFLDHLMSSAQAPIFVLALARPELLARRPALGGRRTSVVRLDPLDDVAMASLVDGLVAGLPPASRDGPGGPCRGHPLVRGRDGAGVDRPRPGGPPRRSVRSGGQRCPRPRRDRCAGLACRRSSRPGWTRSPGGTAGRHRRERAGRVLHRRRAPRPGR